MTSFTAGHLFLLIFVVVIVLKVLGAALSWGLSFILGNKLAALLNQPAPATRPYRDPAPSGRPAPFRSRRRAPAPHKG